jgi:ribosome-binding factor A
MKRSKASPKDLLSSCSQIGPDDNVDPRTAFAERSEKKTKRKALQLCGEAARTLSYALAWETGDDLLGLLQVESVVPAPNCARLLVTVSATGDVAIDMILDRLRRGTGKFRALIAEAVHRRRVPELAFQVTLRN